jgi:hypothetical protein
VFAGEPDAVAGFQGEPGHVAGSDLQGRNFRLVLVLKFPFADAAALLAGPAGDEDERGNGSGS